MRICFVPGPPLYRVIVLSHLSNIRLRPKTFAGLCAFVHSFDGQPLVSTRPVFMRGEHTQTDEYTDRSRGRHTGWEHLEGSRGTWEVYQASTD